MNNYLKSGFIIVSVTLIFSFTKTLISNISDDLTAPIGPYLNTVFPEQGPTWRTVNGFNSLSFNTPMWTEPIPNTEKYLVTSKSGTVVVLDTEPVSPTKTEVLNIPSIFTEGECGVFDIALHPDFETNRYVYLFYSHVPNGIGLNFQNYSYYRISRFTFSEDLTSIDLNSEEVLIQHFDRHFTHAGGGLFFDNQGFLNICLGDEGRSNDSFNNSQDIEKRLYGGILRIDVDQNNTVSHPIKRFPEKTAEHPAGWPENINQGYYIPNDNPWVSDTENYLEEYFIIGLRNPHAVFYDTTTEDIWVADVGQSQEEEINIFKKGDNGQWPYMEGNVSGIHDKPTTVLGNEVGPIYTYGRDVGQSIIGGFVYYGSKYPSLSGKYLFGDFITKNVWSLNRNTLEVELLTNIGTSNSYFDGMSSFFSDHSGENIYMNKLTGTLLELIPPDGSLKQIPSLLSETGAFSDLDNLIPNDGIIPYELNTILYSDGASKKRWIAVPNDGTFNTSDEQIIFYDDDDFEYPDGTVLIKHFEINSDKQNPNEIRKLETRFLIINGDDTYGVTYVWNEAQTDAELISSAVVEDIPVTDENGVTENLTWTYPGRSQCFSCHSSHSNWAIGPKSHSLNKNISYDESDIKHNQLAVWNEMNLFTEPITNEELSTMPRAVSINDPDASNEEKVRSYIDMNCSHCHRPGKLETNFDARFYTDLSEQNIVDEPTTSRNSVEENFIVASGDENRSEMLRRVQALGYIRMPPLGRSTIDEDFIVALKGWIADLGETNSTNEIFITPNNTQIAPNPSVDNFSISFLTVEKEIEIAIFNKTGRKLFSKLYCNKQKINLNHNLSSGAYLIKIKTPSFERTIKHIVK